LNDPQDKQRHTIADHRLGVDVDHDHGDGPGDHDHDHDHDHDDPGAAAAGEHDARWEQDNIVLNSVGIDVGSSGTQVVFSSVRMQRRSEELTSRYVVVERQTRYQSPIALTPYQSETRIDERALGEIVDAAYSAAGLHPDDVDAGAVILTGEALRRENAQAIAEVIAELGGEFVCAAAGHHMESMLAAYGSGCAMASHERDQRLLNVDIGGGTTKLAIVEDGKIVRTGALHIGGRLLVVDEDGRITRLDPAGRRLAAQAGFEWQAGVRVSPESLDRLAEWMAEALLTALTEPSPPASVAGLWLTEPLEPPFELGGIMFSGGVGEYVYGREDRDFHDLGRRLGHALRARLEAGRLPWPVLPAGECIRATALGASEYTVQLSGNTVFISNPAELLPRKNLMVLRPEYYLAGEIVPDRLAAAIRSHFSRFDLVEGEAEVALAFRWRGAPAYERLAAFGRGLTAGMAASLERKMPLYIILDGDVAQSLGALLKEELAVSSEILVIDGVELWDFDYVDLGRIRMPSYTVPVTIKSLVFRQDPRLPHVHAHG
jgi:ethanolamine utilization protein EutA